MSATDVSNTLQAALQASGLNQVKVLHRPRLLSDNGPSYVCSQLGKWLEDKGISHIRGRPYHPMTQGKIERYHRSMKNRILLENFYIAPGQLEHSINQLETITTTIADATGAWSDLAPRLTSTSPEDWTYSNEGKPSNERPSNKDAACISRQSQPEPPNQMSHILSLSPNQMSEMF